MVILGVLQKAIVQHYQRLGPGERRTGKVGCVEHPGCNAPLAPLSVWEMSERVPLSLLSSRLTDFGQTSGLQRAAPIIALNGLSTLAAARLATFGPAS